MMQRIQRIGKDVYTSGLVTSHAGNISLRMDDQMIITRRGTMLGHLKRSDLIQTTIRPPNPADDLASSELPVHRAIYEGTPALAIVHAHPAHAVALSLLTDSITPPDLEASYLLGKIPVVAANLTVVSNEAVDLVPLALTKAKIVVLRGHGTFAIGQHLEEALHWTSVLEHSCRIAFLLRRT